MNLVAQIVSLILAINAAMDLVLIARYIYQRNGYNEQNRTYIMMCFSSFIWSLGFSGMYIEQTEWGAYCCRSFAIAGTFLFMMSAQRLIAAIADVHGIKKNIMTCIAHLGFIIYFFSIQPEQTSYSMTKFGMSYSFTPGPVTAIYNLYFILISLNIVIMLFWMNFKSPSKKVRTFGRYCLFVEIFVAIGTVLDMVFPAIGYDAIPGSNITHFWGVLVMTFAMKSINNSRITITNMSRYIYYSLETPIVVTDAAGMVSLINGAAFDFAKIDKNVISETNKHNISEYFQPEEGFEITEIHKSVTKMFVCKTNQARCNVLISPIYDKFEDCIGYILAITDMTEHYLTLERLEEASREAEAANHAKSAFLANMSHEIRTPMNAIMGFAELALQEQLPQEAEQDIRNIKSASQNLLGIINDILDISKIESGKMEINCEEYQSGHLINGVYSLIKTQTEAKGLEFRIEVEEGIPSVMYGDSQRIREILINLLNNAVKYTKSGFISLNVKTENVKDNECIFTIEISDSGIGIREESMEVLFDSFSRIDSKANSQIEGTGLGLSIVKGYVELMGGTIAVESVFGEGSTFTVTLPQKIIDSTPIKFSPEQGMKESDKFKLGQKSYNGFKVLVVDDNAVNRLVIAKSLAHYGLNVESASSGAESIEKAMTTSYDIIFMDHMMPGMDGVEAMHHIRSECAGYDGSTSNKIVALTANAIQGVREELMGEGFDDYLEKPMNFKELERVLENYLV